jgi:molybdate transport system substrate-binding protein
MLFAFATRYARLYLAKNRNGDSALRFAALRNIAIAFLAVSSQCYAAGKPAPVLTVFAASSLTNALQEIGDQFTRDSGRHVRFSFAASSTLARQIESGVDANVFFAADAEWMNYLQTRGLLLAASRRNLLGNQLVLIAPADSRIQLKIGPGFKLTEALQGGRLATGDPDSVPVGKYAQSALMSLGVWRDVVDRLVRAENVRAAMAFVARGEAPLGIVYRTDALIDKNVRIVDTFPAGSHLPIVYPAAQTRIAHPDAKEFMDYLSRPASRSIFKKYGFTVLP